MPGQKQPVDLVVAKGRKHFTKQDIIDRRAEEIDVPFKDIEAPDYLGDDLRREFYDIAYKLLDIGIMTELDEDTLARYLIAKQHYLRYSKMIDNALRGNKIEKSTELIKTQDRLFKQVRTAAADLGLTITSRVKLVVPKGDGDVDL